ncbi:MAG: preQ(1) synthase [Leptolyngbyaceae bacterium]|nr:preQ(1) synthase [Leptolyngbyaceae bacterium]
MINPDPSPSPAPLDTTTPSVAPAQSTDHRYGDRAIRQAAEEPLEKWPNPSTNPYVIHLEHPEFTALCPRSGYPDFGTIVVDYYPKDWVVELKAFKLYINSFRDRRISHETVTNEVCDRLWIELAPVGLRVIGDYTRRGGVKTVITVCKGNCQLFAPYTQNPL